MSDQSNTSNDKLTIQDIFREIECKSRGGGYIYRGERKRHKESPYNGKVSSNLWREYGIEDGSFDVELVQKEMLAAARRHMGDLRQNVLRDVIASLKAGIDLTEADTDFEILTEIQHYGGKTNLIDFTEILSAAKKHMGDLRQNVLRDVIASLEAGIDLTEADTDFEILTEIQHYGGKTNLIDFTTDYFIALFFACDGDYDEDGRVILQKMDEIGGMIVHPRNPRHRVIVQKSVFVRSAKGFIEPCEGEMVIVPACLKQEILKHLRVFHGISTEVIYNDLQGFIKNQDVHGGAYTHFYKGLVYQERRKYEDAMCHYNEAIKLWPDFAGAYGNRGIVYEKLGDFDNALKDCNKAIELRPDFAGAYCNRGIVYEKLGDFDNALKDCNKAIELRPDFALLYTNRSVVYEKLGDFDNALKDCNKAIELRPDFAGAYYSRGIVYEKLGDFDNAVRDYTEAIELQADFAEAYYNRSVLYTERGNADAGDFDNAIRGYTKAIELRPDFSLAYYNRGIIYTKRGNAGAGDFDNAIRDHTKAIELRPDFADPYNNRGVVYVNLGDFDNAIRDYTEAIELQADFALAYGNRGGVYAKLGDFDNALKDCNKSIELRPNFAELYNNRGLIYMMAGDFDNAVRDYTETIELRPDFSLAYCNRAEAFLHLEKWEEAEADLRAAGDMGTDIIASFQNDYTDVADFEEKNGIQLPENIAALLTPPLTNGNDGNG